MFCYYKCDETGGYELMQSTAGHNHDENALAPLRVRGIQPDVKALIEAAVGPGTLYRSSV